MFKNPLLLLLLCLQLLLQCSITYEKELTPIHQPGYCSMRGQCKMSGFAYLPCVDNGPATSPTSEAFRQQLITTCGASYEEGPVCCDANQLTDLVEQVKRAEPIIASCPACWKNFLQFWCSFTCSPNQSMFVNVTKSVADEDADADDGNNLKNSVDQVDYWVGDTFGKEFYDSCKDIKFGSSNGYAMDFIGGGAKSWHDMMVYMGTKRPLLGSPFQIDFPSLEDAPRNGLERYNDHGQSCEKGPYRCACMDCQGACPILPPTPHEKPECYIGHLRCWSFAMLTTYASIVFLFLIWFFLQQPWVMTKLYQFIHRHGYDHQDRDESTRGRYERLPLSEENENNRDDDYRHGEVLLDPDHTPRRYWLNSRIQSWFYYQGLICARYPWLVIVIGLVVVSICSLGWSHFQVERDPIHLWVSPSSKDLAYKNHFDSHFSPFYRTTQLFLVSEDDESPILTASRLQSLFALEKEISTMSSNKYHQKLQDVCFHPNGDACVVQSITGYWQGDIRLFDPKNWREDLLQCTSQPSLCLPEFQQPLKPQMILGGYENDDDYLSAKAIVITYVLQNSLNTTHIEKSHDWEVSLLSNILSVVNDRPEWDGVRITYSTESSLEIELNKSSNTDAMTVVISYIVMFLYASIALGRFTSWQPRRLLVESKFSLGICGILIVIFSVSTAVGLFSFTGRKTTLIIAEVIPFLVLAVGVDNIFILCHEFDRLRAQAKQDSSEDDGDSIEICAAKTLGKMGPSILLSSISETIAFGLGIFVSMPAVSSFAIVASIAVFVDFLLQVTCFVSCMVLDAYRTEANRLDCLPCIKIDTDDTVQKEGWFETLWNHGFVPFVLSHKTRIITCFIFLGIFMFNLSMVPQVSLGLDQRIALPSDSYLVPYFNDLDNYFNVGPPVYFVVQGVNMTDHSIQKQICGRLPGCDEYSLANILEQERKRPNVSYIGEPTSSWLDDYFQWLNPNVGCCRLKKKSNRSKFSSWLVGHSKTKDLCGPWDDDDDCEPCYPEWSVSDMDSLPAGKVFLEYFDIWINMAPDENCPLGGKAAYGDAIVISGNDHNNNNKGDYVGTTETSHFRTFHTPLKNQDDFIQAYASAHRIADQLSDDTIGMKVYPYSVFYIFFEQYAHLIPMAMTLLGFAIVTIFIITSALLGSIRSGAIVMAVVGMILTDVIGTMALWNISFNAVSLVNLVICVGISVEFCCHIARGFMVSQGKLDERAAKSLSDVGSSVFCGITLTKFAGISVLAFTRSKIFEVYYFRMYLTIVIYGAIHGLILLPILLSLFGGKGMSLLSEINDGGFVLDWNNNENGLLIEDRDSFDQVLITDLPRQRQQSNHS